MEESERQMFSKSNREYEIVIQNKNIPMHELREKISSIGGKIVQKESIYYHIVYVHPYRKNKDFIRLRNEGNRVTLTYKIHNHKFPVEHEIIVNNLNEGNNILKLLGCKYKYECHKLREVWELDGCKEIVFDTYPGIETFAELECDSIKDILIILQKLNLDTNLDKYERIRINKYYNKKYGINKQSKNKNIKQRLTFKTAYDLLLNQAKKNKELLKKRLDEVNDKHKEQIRNLENIII
jgi:adenylate cyclase class IV